MSELTATHSITNPHIILRGTVGVNGYLSNVNETWHDLLGWRDTELVTVPLLTHVHPDDLEAVIAAIHFLYSGGRAVVFSCRYRRKNGTYLWLRWHATPRLEQLSIEVMLYPSAAPDPASSI